MISYLDSGFVPFGDQRHLLDRESFAAFERTDGREYLGIERIQIISGVDPVETVAIESLQNLQDASRHLPVLLLRLLLLGLFFSINFFNFFFKF